MNLPVQPPYDHWPWMKVYPKPAPNLDTIALYPIHQLLVNGALNWPEQAFIDFRGTKITYGEMHDLALKAAGAFQKAGIQKGDRIALLLPNTPAHPMVFFGAIMVGAVIVHLSPLDAPRTMAHKIQDSGARICVTTNFSTLAVGAAKLCERNLIDQLIVVDDEQWGIDEETGETPCSDKIIAWHDYIDNAPLPQIVSAQLDDLVLLQYTGGTTGLPKAAQLTHRNLSAAISSYAAWYELWDLNKGSQQQVLLYLPLFHIYGLSAVMLRAMEIGGQLRLRTRFDPASALDEIEDGAEIFPGVPTMWIAICATPDFEKRNLSSLTMAASGGAPMPVEVANRFSNKTNMELLGGWGMSETAPAGTNIPPGFPHKNGTIGIPLPGIYCKIVALDDPSKELPHGETGEIATFGHNVMIGYWNRPEENKLAFCDGWFLTGDIGFIDEDGFFTIVDRKKDMILSGGFNIYPQMIEQAIYEHDDVEEVLVIGVLDDYRGESAKAFIKMRDGAQPLTLDALQEFLKERLGRHEMPRAIELRAALPRTPVGKLSKIELKQEEAERVAALKA